MKPSKGEGLGEVRQITKFFLCFLGALVTLMSAKYPLIPKQLLPMYQVDAATATDLSSFFTVMAFASSIAVVVCVWNKQTVALRHRRIATSKFVAGAGALLLGISAVAAVSHWTVILVSMRTANVILAAEGRDSIDPFARDTLIELHDPSMSMVRSFKLATDFINDEHVEELSRSELLETVRNPPFEARLLTFYVLAIIGFKAGLLLLSCALYRQKNADLSHRSRPRPARLSEALQHRAPSK